MEHSGELATPRTFWYITDHWDHQHHPAPWAGYTPHHHQSWAINPLRRPACVGRWSADKGSWQNCRPISTCLSFEDIMVYLIVLPLDSISILLPLSGWVSTALTLLDLNQFVTGVHPLQGTDSASTSAFHRIRIALSLKAPSQLPAVGAIQRSKMTQPIVYTATTT